MIDLPVLLAFMAASAALIAMPGPNVAVILATGAAHGTRAALTEVLGTAVAQAAQIAFVVLGLGALLSVWASAFLVLKWLGIAYLVWVGVGLIRSRAVIGQATPATGRLVLRGAATALANPKTLVFHAAFLPLFVDPARPAAPQLVILAAIFVVTALVLDSLWACAGGAMSRLFAGERLKTWANKVSGGTLMLAAAWLALRREGSTP